MAKCTECGGKLQVQGTGGFGDTIEVECVDCGNWLELEPDGLDCGGLEWVAAKMIDESGYTPEEAESIY
ncbi:MAG: hypothetical protein ACYTFG_17870 [Planctomycetota bacterium]|jgi:hypothetical protein